MIKIDTKNIKNLEKKAMVQDLHSLTIRLGSATRRLEITKDREIRKAMVYGLNRLASEYKTLLSKYNELED